MWTRARVDEILSTYQADAARVEHLKLEIAEMQSAIDKIMATLEDDEITIKAQVITGMPHGTTVQSPTEQIAVRLLSGWEPVDVRELKEEIRLRELELRDIDAMGRFVRVWLSALPERERWLITKQVIEHTFWRDVIDDYARAFQVRLSQDSLGRMKKRAMEKIYRTAGAVE